ncbi:MAG: tRNA (adenosine(37)-N6)-threonylcarbamoyltransferase complex dimerization subunit type 1 TsaB [Bacilli bacterium]|nr:tRNA (adenosine(37)-N6)-threonylcarbamoyltransferase complex dimerization subunit type 1 TsaB [Bacilli bacterium]
MYTILLDSSNTKLAVGIAKNGIVLKSTIYEAWQEQSEHMIPELNEILNAFDVKKEEIDDAMVAIGPGSYTGVRIAITIAKTMGYALQIPVFPVSSLQILKDGTKPSICVVNARSKRSYVGVYQGNNILLFDQIMTNVELLKYIEEHPDYSLCGNLSYLGLEGIETNTINEMLSLKPFITPMEDSLSLKPVYLKD